MMLRLLVCGSGLLGLVCLLILSLNWVHGLRINSRKLNLISACAVCGGDFGGDGGALRAGADGRSRAGRRLRGCC